LGSADAELSLGTIYQYLEGVPHNVTNISIKLPSDKFRQATLFGNKQKRSQKL